MSRHLFLALSKALGGCPRHHKCRPHHSISLSQHNKQTHQTRAIKIRTSARTERAPHCTPAKRDKDAILITNCTVDHRCTNHRRIRRRYPHNSYTSLQPSTVSDDPNRDSTAFASHHHRFHSTSSALAKSPQHVHLYPRATNKKADDARSVDVRVQDAWQTFKTIITASNTKSIPTQSLRNIYSTLARVMRRERSADRVRTVALYMQKSGIQLSCEELEHLVIAQRILRNWREALSAFDSLRNAAAEKTIGSGAYDAAIKAYIKIGDMRSALDLLDEMKGRGTRPNVGIFSTLMDGAVLNGDSSLAETLFEMMVTSKITPNARCYALLLTALQGERDALRKVYEIAQTNGIQNLEGDPVFQRSLVTVVSRLGNPELASSHLMVLKDLYKLNTSDNLTAAYTSVINAFLKHDGQRGLKMGEQLFEEMQSNGLKPNLRTYTVMMHGYYRYKGFDEVVKLLQRMIGDGITPDTIVYNIVIRACVLHGDVKTMENIFNGVMDLGMSPNIHILSSLMAGYAISGDIDKAVYVFERLAHFQVQPDLVCFNIIINGFGLKGDVAGCVRWWKKMLDHKIRPDKTSYTCLLQAMSKALHPEFTSVYENDFKVEPDVHAYTLLIDDRLRRGELVAAQHLFYDLIRAGVEMNAVSVTSLMNAYLKRGEDDAVREMFQRFMHRGGTVDAAMYHVLMRMFLRAKGPAEVLKLWDEMQEGGVEPDMGTYGAIIAAYMQLWDLDAVWTIMDEMRSRNIYPNNQIWYTVIAACIRRRHNQGVQYALRAYRRMLDEGCVPSAAIFKSLITMAALRGDVEMMMDLVKDSAAGGIELSDQVRDLVYQVLCDKGDTKRLLLEMVDVSVKTGHVDDVDRTVKKLQARGEVGKIMACWERFAQGGVPIGGHIVARLLEAIGIKCGARREARYIWRDVVEKRYPSVGKRMPVEVVIVYARALAYWEEVDELVHVCTEGLIEMGMRGEEVEKVLAETMKVMRWKWERRMKEVIEFWREKGGGVDVGIAGSGQPKDLV